MTRTRSIDRLAWEVKNPDAQVSCNIFHASVKNEYYAVVEAPGERIAINFKSHYICDVIAHIYLHKYAH